MAYHFPPDVARLVNEQLAGYGYASEDEVLRDALRVLREFKAREEQLLADVRVGLDEADRGLARPLDVDALTQLPQREDGFTIFGNNLVGFTPQVVWGWWPVG